MRTDGIDMAPEAVRAARDAITGRYGAAYVPEKPRIYKNKAKNAQEAHECIRPTDMGRDAGALGLLEADQRKLYDLIWKRTLASQMAAARLERTTVEIGAADGQVGLRATGQVVLFDGFLKVYEEGRDEPAEDDADARRLPQIARGDALATAGVTPEQHFTQPPPRYTEATLVKKMEELGIGRPSTYAAIVTTIQDRGYVSKEGGRLRPEDSGRLVTSFLIAYFQRYVGYDFTAGLEAELDEISAGDKRWTEVLARFWREFRAALDETSELRITDVLEKITEALGPHLFPPREDGTDPRLCPNCGVGRLSLKTARAGGAFIGCSNYPNCRFTRPMGPPGAPDENAIPPDGKLLGAAPDGEAVTLRDGRFGPYVQKGAPTEAMPKPPRASVPKGMAPEAVDLAKALDLLALPRHVGDHPEDGAPVEAGIGRYGPYVRHGRTYANLDDADEVFTVGMNRAVELLAAKKAGGGRGRRGAPPPPLRELGAHPEDGAPLQVMEGRYGPYIKWGKVNATLPNEADPKTIDFAAALALVNDKAAKGGKGRRKAPAKRKAPATRKKTATKG
jgi:DNA topoisomerase-1